MSQKFSYTPNFLLILISLVLLLVTGCDRGNDATKVKAKALVKLVMETRQKAIQTKDIELYKQTVFPGYSDGGVNFDGLIEEMQDAFKRYESITFTYQRSAVDMDMNSARMVGQISYQATGMEKPVYAQERTIFRRVDGKWTISAGIQTGMF